MQNNWLSCMDLDTESSKIFVIKPIVSLPLTGHLLCQIVSFVDNSLQQSKNYHTSGSLVLRNSLNSISKFAGALLIWFTSGSATDLYPELSGDLHSSKVGSCQSSSQAKHISSCKDNLTGFQRYSRSRAESSGWMLLGQFMSSTIKRFRKEFQQFHSIPGLSLAAAFVPPFSNFLQAGQLENNDAQISGQMDQVPRVGELQGCANITYPQINWTGHAFEPRTGIKFPMVLHNIFSGEDNISMSSEVLVGTGFRSMRILKIKSLKVYAFGVYVQPDSVCEKLGPKYASMPMNELNNQHKLLEDLFREDINMTVRLVVNCNGLKINTVRNAFEKSLQTRLSKMNPKTDDNCLRTFSSYFEQDIPLPVGTTIDFRQTSDGKLITEIGGKQIGAIHSKDLCRAFFDIYIGDVSASGHAKEEITRNLATIIRRF